MERTMVFIDGSNLYYGLKANSCPTRISFFKLGQLLTGENRRLIRVYYYNASYPDAVSAETRRDQQKFFSAVRRMPRVSVILGKLKLKGDTLVQKGVDTRIVTDMIIYAYRDNYDTAILISGDGDFACALQAVGELGKNVENAYFRESRSLDLENWSDEVHQLTLGLIKQCLA